MVPAAVEPAGLHIPDRIPVAVGIPLVRNRLIDEAADRIGIEEQRVATVVEGVDQEAEQVVVQHVERVAAQLGRHPFFRRRRIPAAARDVQVLLVEHHPGVRPLGGAGALVRKLLNEVRNRRDRLVDRLVQLPVDLQRRGEPDGAHGRLPAFPGDHRRRNGRRRTVDGNRGRGGLGGLRRRSAGRGRRRLGRNDDRIGQGSGPLPAPPSAPGQRGHGKPWW